MIQPLKVMPCPVWEGKHICHDHRWIATADATVEHADNGTNDWRLSEGSLICQMRDVDQSYARLFAAAPDLLAALEKLHSMSGENGVPLSISALAGFQNEVFKITAKAIAKAKGTL